MLLFRWQGADGTRVFTVSSVLGPAKAQRCQAGPRPALLPKLYSENFRPVPNAHAAALAHRAKRLLRVRTTDRPHKR